MYANQNQTAKYTPLAPKTNYKNCNLCRSSVYTSLLHIILLSVSLFFKLPERSLRFDFIPESCSYTQTSTITSSSMRKHGKAMTHAGNLTSLLHAQGARGDFPTYRSYFDHAASDYELPFPILRGSRKLRSCGSMALSLS